MPMFSITFTVEGRSSFPLDMLRYDQCHPVDGESCMALINKAAPSPRNTQTCKLRRYFNTSKRHLDGLVKGNNVATNGRWLSFGWSVIPDSIEVYQVGTL